MRRLNRARGTRCAGGDRKALKIERYHQRLTFDVIKTDVGRGRNSGRIATIDFALIHLAEHRLLQTIP